MTKRFTVEQQKEKARKRTKAWWTGFKERDPEGYKEYRQKAKQRRIKKGTLTTEMMLFRNARARARRDGREFTLKLSDIVIPSHCPILGLPLVSNSGGRFCDNSPSIDRINSKMGYIKENIIVISYRANSIKRDATVEELEALASFYRRLEGGNKAKGNKTS